MKVILVILGLLIPQMALARIGETKEQCNARYGKPLFEMQGRICGKLQKK